MLFFSALKLNIFFAKLSFMIPSEDLFSLYIHLCSLSDAKTHENEAFNLNLSTKGLECSVVFT